MNYTALEMPKAGDTVLVGMSGGVDSTLTALLLKQKGCKVIGVTMTLWDKNNPTIPTDKPQKEACYGPGEEENVAECEKFCKQHDIEYVTVDCKEQYKVKVLEYFKSEYRSGRTPNPCIMCNRNIKFGAMLEAVEALGIKFDYFCTGHYAKVVRPDEGIWGTNERPVMISGATDVSKDQTYFLYRIPSAILEKVRFPLATVKKSEVFELAKQANLDAADRAESQDFIGAEYFDLLFADKPSVPGDIVDLDGHILGRHRGIEHYTIGQRKGLGVSAKYPVYVQSIDVKNNLVVLAPNDALNSSAFYATDFVWPGNVEPKESFKALVKIRLASKPVPCTVEKAEDTETPGSYKITFDEPQRAVAPGQSAVLYIDGAIVGGGIIDKTID